MTKPHEDIDEPPSQPRLPSRSHNFHSSSADVTLEKKEETDNNNNNLKGPFFESTSPQLALAPPYDDTSERILSSSGDDMIVEQEKQKEKNFKIVTAAATVKVPPPDGKKTIHTHTYSNRTSIPNQPEDPDDVGSTKPSYIKKTKKSNNPTVLTQSHRAARRLQDDEDFDELEDGIDSLGLGEQNISISGVPGAFDVPIGGAMQPRGQEQQSLEQARQGDYDLLNVGGGEADDEAINQSGSMVVAELAPEPVQGTVVPRQPWWKVWRWTILFIIVPVIVGMTVLIVVLLKEDDVTKTPTPTIVTTSPSEMPTTAPTVECLVTGVPEVSNTTTLEEAIAVLSPYIMNIDLNANLTIHQENALKWLLEYDDGLIFEQDEIRISERYALAVLFYSTNGTFWNQNTTCWLSDRSVCNWKGVSCREEDERVNQLDLIAYGLMGTIPPTEIQNLMALTLLNLEDNQLNGPIPSQLGNLTELKHLSLYQNFLTGSIPSALSRLTEMTLLYVSRNDLTNSIPADLSQLTKLTGLDFSTNSFTGTIPEEFGSFVVLKDFWMGGNSLLSGTIPSSLGRLTKLIELWIDGNSITSTIPSELGNLTTLQRLELCCNNLVGSIPTEFGMMREVRDISLYANDLSSTIPSEIGALSLMTYLWLDANELTGTIPSEIGQMAAMAYLTMPANLLTGSIPTELALMTALTDIDLSFNNLSGNITEPLKSFLETLSVCRVGEGNPNLLDVPDNCD